MCVDMKGLEKCKILLSFQLCLLKQRRISDMLLCTSFSNWC
uniref:Uncharacterized protein n=1 Tax=Arundo donax TaxID=35708 RepID=A0A0A8Z8F8_ARUDO